MIPRLMPSALKNDHVLGCLVLAAAAIVAVVSARDYAGGWNDGSRLATVECLVDHHTLVIDESIFVTGQPVAGSSSWVPYRTDDPERLAGGTGDKLYIGGHFYSDKSPVPALLMAGYYQILQWCLGLRARERPDRFCYWMTLGSSGAAYVMAVGSIFWIGARVHLRRGQQLGLAASFGLCTVALPYVRHVNNHILLLGVAAALWALLCRIRKESTPGRFGVPRLVTLGTLAGLAYAIDLGAGPVLLLCLLPLVYYRCRQVGALVILLLAASPWLVLHHVVNYMVGGTFKPANAVPEYFQWPGCAFSAQNMTGAWNHTMGHFLVYAAALLAGKRGFLGHNLPLYLALGGLVVLLKRHPREWPEILLAVCWSGGTWLAYALTSTNYSGQCCTIRWFVPLLAPGYYVLAVLLREVPSRSRDLLLLSGWGAALACLMWWHGPWMAHMVPGYWLWQTAALASWLLCCAGFPRLKSSSAESSMEFDQPKPEAA